MRTHESPCFGGLGEGGEGGEKRFHICEKAPHPGCDGFKAVDEEEGCGSRGLPLRGSGAVCPLSPLRGGGSQPRTMHERKEKYPTRRVARRGGGSPQQKLLYIFH